MMLNCYNAREVPFMLTGSHIR